MIPHRIRGFMVLLWLSCSTPAVLAQPDPPATPPPAAEVEVPLPKLQDVPLPEADELLRGKPTDWIVLLNKDVIFVEPVTPRPGTLELLKKEFDELQRTPVTKIPLEEKLQRLAELQRIQVTLLSDPNDPEYTIETRFIGEIIFFEDQILRRIQKLYQAGNLEKAYELLMFLDRRHRGWPGAHEAYLQFLFLETVKLADEGKFEAALLSIERLHALQADYPELSRQLGRIADGLISAGIDDGDFRRARHFLGRVQRLQPDHEQVAHWTGTLTALSQQALQSARNSRNAGDHRSAALSADHAALIWPTLSGLKEEHRQFIDRYQILKVGVLADAAKSGSYPFSSLAEDRQHRLCELLLFEEDRIHDGRVRYRSRWIEAWEPRDLGRDIYFRLQPRRANWESRPVVTAGEIADLITERLGSNPLQADARWQRDVVAVSANSPLEWNLKLSHIPLRIESRLRIPIPLTAASAARSRDITLEIPETTLNSRFVPDEGTPNVAIFRRTRPQPVGSEIWHIAEVDEHSYPNWPRLLQGLLRGEIDFIPTAEWVDLAGLSHDQRFFVHRAQLPRTDLLQIHPDSVLTSSASLRRALLHALNRQAILQEVILKDASPEYGRLVTGPFASKLSAYDAQLRQPENDPIRAASLVATVRRQWNGPIPTLKLAIPGDAVTKRVVPELIAAWKRVGIPVEVIPPESDAPWDLAYRTLQLADPTEDVWSLLHPAGRTEWKSLAIYPHWLRERLWELEQTVDWPTAESLMRQIQAEFLQEVRWLPLWEVDQFTVIRKRMTGLRTEPLHSYQDIERWTLQSWYPTGVP